MNKRCCVNVAEGGRSVRCYPCSKPYKVTRDGRDYCTIHDPEHESPADRRYRQSKELTAAIENEADVLVKRLGVDGHAEYVPYYKSGEASRSRHLVLSFEVVEQLLKELGR